MITTKKVSIMKLISLGIIIYIFKLAFMNNYFFTFEGVVNAGAKRQDLRRNEYTIELQNSIANNISLAIIESQDNYGFVCFEKTPYLPIYKYKTSLYGADLVTNREGENAYLLNLSTNHKNEEITMVVFKCKSGLIPYDAYNPDIYIVKDLYTILIWEKRISDTHKLFTDYFKEGI